MRIPIAAAAAATQAFLNFTAPLTTTAADLPQFLGTARDGTASGAHLFARDKRQLVCIDLAPRTDEK